MRTFGTVLLMIGLLIAVLFGLDIITIKQLADIDPVEINNPDKISLYWSPITAVVLLVAGVIVLIISKRKNKVSRRYYS